MRGKLLLPAAMLVVSLVAVPPGAVASRSTRAPSMTVSAAPGLARAHRVRLTITLRYVMQCGYPGAGPLVVTFPAAVRLPRRFAAGAVRLSGKAVAAKLAGRHVTVTVPPHEGVLCGTIGPGAVTLRFTHAASLTNPARAGSYRFTAMHAKHTFSATLVVEPAA